MRFVFALLLLALPASLSAGAQTASSPATPPATPPAMVLRVEAPSDFTPPDFPAVALTMTTPLGDFPMLVELALTPAAQQWGLMFRPDLPDDYGMLFVMREEAVQSFWMRNTPSPLDIIYINSDNIVVSIAKGEPLNEASLPSAGPAKFVFEIRQGLSEVYGIEPGTALVFK